jgi:hypothetical protein
MRCRSGRRMSTPRADCAAALSSSSITTIRPIRRWSLRCTSYKDAMPLTMFLWRGGRYVNQCPDGARRHQLPVQLEHPAGEILIPPSGEPLTSARLPSRLVPRKFCPDHIKDDVCEACVGIRFATLIDQSQQLWNKQRRLRQPQRQGPLIGRCQIPLDPGFHGSREMLLAAIQPLAQVCVPIGSGWAAIDVIKVSEIATGSGVSFATKYIAFSRRAVWTLHCLADRRVSYAQNGDGKCGAGGARSGYSWRATPIPLVRSVRAMLHTGRLDSFT